MSDQSEIGADVPLTEAERQALDALSPEIEPGRLLEERTVRALRERGLLTPVGGVSVEVGRPTRRPGHAWRALVAIAAAVLLFASGISVGQIIGARQTTEAVEAALGSPELLDAMRVQQAGTDYVEAVAALAERATSEDSAARAQGVEVALTALWAAANEIVRLAPEDPLAARILLEFDRTRARDQQPQDAAQGELVIWN